MKHESRQTIRMEKSLLVVWMGPLVVWDRVSRDLQGWANGVSQVDGAFDMAPPTSSVAPWVEGSGKRQWPLSVFLFGRKLSPSSHLDARHFSSSLYATGAFESVTPVLELRGECICVSVCVGSLRGTFGDYRRFFHWLNPRWCLQPEVMGTYLLGTGTLGWEI